jgi:hypothetical protein
MQLGRPDRSSLDDGWYDFHAALGGPELEYGVARPPLRFRSIRRQLPHVRQALKRVRRIPSAIPRRARRLLDRLRPV